MLQTIVNGYETIHHPVSLFLSVFGIVSNLLTITILQRKILFVKSINSILTSLALIQIGVCGCYAFVTFIKLVNDADDCDAKFRLASR